jgi:PKD repeat protein
VDTLSDRLMFRLQYRNFGTHQTLVTNQSVDVNGSDHAGIRWYELRNTGSGWSIYQQGTYSPDSHHNWMGSIAMNSQGDIALGYSKSSSSYYPSIFVTGRWSGDTPGDMTQGQTVIVNGSGHQTHSAGRWGDYSHMSVDPTDDCTFWYTQEYYAVKGSAPWQTRIGSFKLRECGPTNDPPSVSINGPAEATTVSGTTVPIVITANDTEDTAGSLTVQWNADGGDWQSAAYDSGTGKYKASWNSTGVADGNHAINARATDSGNKTGSDSNSVFVDNVNDPPVASFTFSCSGLTCNFDGSASSDADGTISYSWDFNNDGTQDGSGATANHTYSAAGTYTVVLTVTDNDGTTDTETKNVTVSDAAASMHVGDLDGSKTIQGPTKWKANVTITVHDASHVPLSGGTVTGAWSNGGTSSCTTNGGGQCSVSKNNIANSVLNVTFTVTGVTGSLPYDSSDNHDDDLDSNGTSITISKPQ